MSQDTQNPNLTEESVVAKVAELLETLDHVRQYNELYHSFQKFALIVGTSIAVFLLIGASLNFANLNPSGPEILLESGLLLIIPVVGTAIGVYYIKRRLHSVKQGEWKTELSNGIPGALKILSDIDWDKTLDEISSGRYSYGLYGVLKAFAYWIIVSFALAPLGNIISILALHRTGLIGFPIVGFVALIVVFFLLRKDLNSRFNEIRALDKILWELRWFSLELRRAEF